MNESGGMKIDEIFKQRRQTKMNWKIIGYTAFNKIKLLIIILV